MTRMPSLGRSTSAMVTSSSVIFWPETLIDAGVAATASPVTARRTARATRDLAWTIIRLLQLVIRRLASFTCTGTEQQATVPAYLKMALVARQYLANCRQSGAK